MGKTKPAIIQFESRLTGIGTAVVGIVAGVYLSGLIFDYSSLGAWGDFFWRLT